jgi:8-hydroxy-5-deazaflavin:NADPH oxidoreductase
MDIAIVGGTGREGRGLAMRWARAGHHVFIGSRDAGRARERAAELSAYDAGWVIQGGDNAWAAAQAKVVLLSVPYAAHAATLHELKPALLGRTVIDITVPLAPPKVSQVHLPVGHAAALETQAILGEGTKVVATLHHVSSSTLGDPDCVLDHDALVASDHEDARELAIGLVNQLGLRGLDAGPLRNAIALEALTPVLLHLCKRYKGSAGVRFVGLEGTGAGELAS